METNSDPTLEARIKQIATLCRHTNSADRLEAAMLAQSVLHDSVGGKHPLMAVVTHAIQEQSPVLAIAASEAIIKLFKEGKLTSPRLTVAHEIEGNLLDVAQSQLQTAEISQDPTQKQISLAIAGFLAGAALEDALRRLCDAGGISYDTERTTISKLQSALFQPNKQIEIISASENKHITAWGDVRNKADHARFSEITYTEVITMLTGVRAFIDKHLP